MNHLIMFLDQDNQVKLVPAPFSFFFHEQKIHFSSKSVIVVTAIISLHYKETNETVLFTFLLQKGS